MGSAFSNPETRTSAPHAPCQFRKVKEDGDFNHRNTLKYLEN